MAIDTAQIDEPITCPPTTWSAGVDAWRDSATVVSRPRRRPVKKAAAKKAPAKKAAAKKAPAKKAAR